MSSSEEYELVFQCLYDALNFVRRTRLAYPYATCEELAKEFVDAFAVNRQYVLTFDEAKDVIDTALLWLEEGAC
jgi:hypothetical protein